ncbi:MAG: 2-oxoglutarate dehydrogenase complex dihydrolipoyllysine-residue succinyltransferase [Pseudomonadota bacterium]
MGVEIRVPSLGESVTEATVAKWFKKIGDVVVADEPIVELETDKVTLEFNAPASGTLAEITVEEGGDVEVGALLGSIDEGAGLGASVEPAPEPATSETAASAARSPSKGDGVLSPAVRKLIDEHGLDPSTITPTGPKGNLTKADVLAALEAPEKPRAAPAPPPAKPPKASPLPPAPSAAKVPPPDKPAAAPSAPAAKPTPPPPPAPAQPAVGGAREERVKMTRLRRRIAERLKEAQNTAAILTTYNEADMSGVMAARTRYRDTFEKKHGVRLGFMSFFVKASISALQAFPTVNAEIDGDEIVYHHRYDIGVAVGTPSGLVVPIVRDADRRSFAEIEQAINALGARARDGQLSMEELVGGTFTISNGGVYGSLMSSPILNPPQVGIFGMHKIQERPIGVGGEIKVRPMMYLALSYDHRIVDGREAVSFLVRVKECIENPERLLFDV